MITHEEFEAFILSLPDVWLDNAFDKKALAYKYGPESEGKIVAVVSLGSQPLRISLKCDPQLAEILRERYETVLPGENLNKNHWNTIICSGQLPDSEIFDFTRHSYLLVSGKSKVE